MPAIDKLFDQLLTRGGGDLHLGVDHPPLTRVRGDLVPLGDGVLGAADLDSLLLPLLSPQQKERFAAELDLDFAYAYGTRARFRANYFHKTSGIAAVFRSISTEIRALADLGAPDILKALALRRSGLVLVTGPAGSGKSTTLAAMIRHVNETRACHILTIEDPVELVHAPIKAQVTHREVGAHAESFATAIRSARREDPDVVLIGELRDTETMKLALSLASFGVLVLATLPTNSAPATVDRIVSSFAEGEQPEVRGLLADSLAGIVAQQLLKTPDGVGRVVLQEILISTPAVAAMIREGKTFQIAGALQAGQAVGMQTNDMALERLLSQKRITYEMALSRYADTENAEKRLKPLAALA